MLADVIRKYQKYDPATGKFTKHRTTAEYAEVIGLHRVYLSQIFSGARRPGTQTFARLMQAFPTAAPQIAADMAAAMAVDHKEAVPA